MNVQDEQKLYKKLSESATRLFDVMLGEGRISDIVSFEFEINRRIAMIFMGVEWTRHVIKQSFNLVADCYHDGDANDEL
jgi:hypothetical protein